MLIGWVEQSVFVSCRDVLTDEMLARLESMRLERGTRHDGIGRITG